MFSYSFERDVSISRIYRKVLIKIKLCNRDNNLSQLKYSCDKNRIITNIHVDYIVCADRLYTSQYIMRLLIYFLYLNASTLYRGINEIYAYIRLIE